ncbi:DNA polymerase LigD domain protein [Mycobacterium ulcerans str. Harvey]|uniref:DNA polymerase LigD domain protein n=1 Tax=Mycobacterium ulcerans str. Harvey TaxID=1299332 RepID=A0ABN0R3G1_MYCUL|nr:DNA polymerase LigD domain protein [Mycobacterium ulcerans str. Harvey]
MTGPVSLELAGRQVKITHPDRVVFPGQGDRPSRTKLDLVRYYLSVADGALRGVAGRPMMLKRFVKGIDVEAVFQKRAPTNRPTGWTLPSCATRQAPPPRKRSSTMPRDWPGRSTWVASI